MRIILSNSTDEAIETVINALLDKISSHPGSVIGLATGRTMIPLYAKWVSWAKLHKVDHSKCTFFMLDEYLDIGVDHPSSFKQYIITNFMAPLGLNEEQFKFPPVNLKQLTMAGTCYENEIKSCGGIDIQLLGIGTNGHIGFNEPGSIGNSRTRMVELSEETKKVNSSSFRGKMPTRAISMGIGTILDSKEIILLATGKSKADAIKYLGNHHDDLSCPATFLKSHPHFTLVLDPEASSKINLKI